MAGLTVLLLGTQWVVGLAPAVVASLMVMGLRTLPGSTLAGYLLGVPAFVALAQLLLFRRGMPIHLQARQLYIREPGEQPDRGAQRSA